MRITGIKTFVVGMPGHNTILVKIETDEDLFGIGEASLAGRDQGVIGVLRHFESLLVGRDPSRIEDIWQELYRNTYLTHFRNFTERQITPRDKRHGNHQQEASQSCSSADGHPFAGSRARAAKSP